MFKQDIIKKDALFSFVCISDNCKLFKFISTTIKEINMKSNKSQMRMNNFCQTAKKH